MKKILLSLLTMFATATTTWADVAFNAINFPDENFRNWLLSQDYGSDGMLTDVEIENITSINVGLKNIQSLKGIEYFTALTTLECYTNQLTSLDVSKNKALSYLRCESNKLTSLDVTSNTALKTLLCGANQLTSLDVSNNTLLTRLDCGNPNLNTLDVSGCRYLYELNISGTQLTSLDLSGKTNLKKLHCVSNQLKSLNVSGCTSLRDLFCYNNQLTTLNVSGCSGLKELYCSNNQLTAIDATGCVILRELQIQCNKIQGKAMDDFIASLPTTSGRTMFVINNENESNVMTTTQVEAAKAKGWTPNYYNNGWQEYSGSEPTLVGIAINETNFPDENFRNWILSQEYGEDGVLTDEEIADVMSIKVNDKNIQSLKGIEYLTELEYLFCQSNLLESLDLSKNTKLTYLNCGGNQLTSLDLSGCTAMTELWCFENQLTSLGISKCTALTKLYCYKNQLTSLDISACTALESMNCSSNQLTSLDVLRCSGLQLLNCSENQLTSLDLSHNTVLESLQCYDNKLTSLNVTNTALVYIGCYRNQLNSTAMSAFVNGLPQITCGKEWDGLMYIVENENEGNVMTPTQVATATAKGWNPHYYDGKEWVPYADIKPVLRGDVNEDGVVNGTDIQEVINIIVNAD